MENNALQYSLLWFSSTSVAAKVVTVVAPPVSIVGSQTKPGAIYLYIVAVALLSTSV